MNADPLGRIKLNIEWSKRNIGKVEAAIRAYSDSNPWTVITHDDLQAQEKVYKVVLSRPPDPFLGPEVACITHALRSTLDHLACCLARENGFTDTKGTYFVICNKEEVFKEKGTQRRIEKLSLRARECIERLQPHNGGDKYLRILHDLDVVGKHVRLLPIGIGDPRNISIDLYPGFDCSKAARWPRNTVRRWTWLRWDSLQQGIELFATELGSDLKPDVHVTTSVAFQDVEGLEREPIVTVLNQFVDVVERIVGIFERRFF